MSLDGEGMGEGEFLKYCFDFNSIANSALHGEEFLLCIYIK